MLRLTVLQIEDRDHELQGLLLAHNRLRCKLDGIDYVFQRGLPQHPDVPPYWWKVYAVREWLHRTAPADGAAVLWVDSDAILGPADARRLLDTTTTSMWISPDSHLRHWSRFCAGAFLVRNDAVGRRLMDAWWGLFRPDCWTRQPTGEWHGRGPWAGPCYEQGAFVDHLLDDPHWAPHIRILPYHVLNEPDWARPHTEAVVIHLAGEWRETFRAFRFAQRDDDSGAAAPRILLLLFAAGLVLWIVCAGQLTPQPGVGTP